jgi:hypothetical protein
MQPLIIGIACGFICVMALFIHRARKLDVSFLDNLQLMNARLNKLEDLVKCLMELNKIEWAAQRMRSALPDTKDQTLSLIKSRLRKKLPDEKDPSGKPT